MTSMTEQFDRYLAERRAFGADLAFAERVLRKFARFADDAGHDHITSDVFLAWKRSYGQASNATWATRLSMARGFAQWLSARDPRTEVPPLGLIHAPGPRRGAPYIYEPSQIAALLAAAGRLPSAYGLRARTWQTVYGLIAVTGLRLNEALHLEVRDVDLDQGLLHVRHSKNGGDRVLPLHADTSERLRSYVTERDRILVGLHDAVAMPETRFFLGEDGRPVSEHGVRYNFAVISRSIGLRGPQRFHRHGHGPRIHDLRHTFAVRTILGWFREGRDVDREMSKLSAYLGHASPEGSYWYIKAVPELMELAAARAERRWQEVVR